jgi:DUF1680 family protein
MKCNRILVNFAGLCIISALVVIGCTPEPGNKSFDKNTIKVASPFDFIPAGATRLTNGILADRYNKNIDNLYLAIDNEVLKNVFKETHDNWYAEPEFVGHYLASGPLLYRASGNEEIKIRNEELVKTILEYQREDGYLGTYHEGLEFDYTFSVWNQNFMIKGLIAQYEQTGDEAILEAAMKCADYNANAFLYSDTVELLLGLNQGIQHATILEEMAHLYAVTGKQLYLDFANYILKRLENSSIKVISIPNTAEFWALPFMMGCSKGIEMFNIYFGVLKMYEITGNVDYLHAAQIYWKALQNAQIRITGNGSLGEHWNHIGNTPVELTNDLRPNENCVAMGWMKFNADLSLFSGEAKYYDELEKTLYNHIMGSQALDGHDFSYYQGNIGHKIHEKDPGMYSCCRYRGMRILALLPDYIYMQSENQVAVNLFTPSTTTASIGNANISIAQSTKYPKDGQVRIHVQPDQKTRFSLFLRQPEWAEEVTVKIDGETIDCPNENGYLVIDREWASSGHEIDYLIDMTVNYIEASINEKPCAAVKYGPLVLAIDSRYGTPIQSTQVKLGDELELTNISSSTNEYIPQVMFQTEGTINGKESQITLVDYASAGSLNAGVDEFRVWIPVVPE